MVNNPKPVFLVRYSLELYKWAGVCTVSEVYLENGGEVGLQTVQPSKNDLQVRQKALITNNIVMNTWKQCIKARRRNNISQKVLEI